MKTEEKESMKKYKTPEKKREYARERYRKNKEVREKSKARSKAQYKKRNVKEWRDYHRNIMRKRLNIKPENYRK